MNETEPKKPLYVELAGVEYVRDDQDVPVVVMAFKPIVLTPIEAKELLRKVDAYHKLRFYEA